MVSPLSTSQHHPVSTSLILTQNTTHDSLYRWWTSLCHTYGDRELSPSEQHSLTLDTSVPMLRNLAISVLWSWVWPSNPFRNTIYPVSALVIFKFRWRHHALKFLHLKRNSAVLSMASCVMWFWDYSSLVCVPFVLNPDILLGHPQSGVGVFCEPPLIQMMGVGLPKPVRFLLSGRTFVHVSTCMTALGVSTTSHLDHTATPILWEML
jgi:hypothetical protein